MRHRVVSLFAAVSIVLSLHMGAIAQFKKNDPAPRILARDIYGKTVDLEQIIQQGRDLVILFFFSQDAGEDMALKLHSLDTAYGGKHLEVIALGWEEDAVALKTFAEKMGIRYYIIEGEKEFNTADWKSNVDVLPLTLFVVTNEEMRIERVLRGGGQTKANLLAEVAESFFQQRKLDTAQAIADKAIADGESPADAREVKGFILTAQGKLDEAEKEFGEINSTSGLAKVALERGDYDKAAEIASSAPADPYAQTVKGEALMRTGKLDEAASTLASAASAEGARDWQVSEALNANGRVAHAKGEREAAIQDYQKAVAFDPYNVEPLSNEAAAHRESGDLAKAEAVLEKAVAIRPDELTSAMLRQIQQELKEANDLKRKELIRSQIEDLSKRYKEMQESGAAQTKDEWSTRPIILAFLPSSSQAPLVFTRAGTDIVLQRELESKLQGDSRVSIVERGMLDALLQELNLGSSELTSADTQRRLGQVLSAGQLGFIDYARVGAEAVMYLRMVDTETTGITFQTSKPVDEGKPLAAVDALAAEVVANVVDGGELRGLIADASDESAVIINLGRKHGVKEGQEFTVLADGPPIEVGGRVIAHRQKPIGKLSVTAVEDEYAICSVSNKRDGETLAKEMKVKLSK